MAKISIVTPVYNVSALLSRCVDSILSQTFRDFDLILVDDGSKDNSLEICRDYAKKDPRVIVLTQENGGPSAARNHGIDWAFENSDSQWLCYIDSDDWVHPRMLEMLQKAAREENVLCSICGYTETWGDELAPGEDSFRIEACTPDDFFVRDNMLATTPWAKLYHKSCFEGRRYPVGKIHEDEYLTYHILFEQEKLAYVPAPLYAYFYNPDGITKGEWTPARLDGWGALEEQIVFFRNRGNEKMAVYCLYRYMRNTFGQMMEIRECPHRARYAREEKMAHDKAKELLKEANRCGTVSFDRDFAVLREFYPLQTYFWLYWTAAKRRLKLDRRKED